MVMKNFHNQKQWRAINPMKTYFRALLGFMAGLVLAFGLVIAVEAFSAVVHPMPPDSKMTMDEMCQHVARYPDWVLAVVVPLWGATAFLGTRVASRLGGRWAGLALTVLLTVAIGYNIVKLPYVMWFKAAMPIAFALACYLGNKPRPVESASVPAESLV